MAKQVKSWSKPDNVPGLIGRKRVDLSVFRYGSHIPIPFHEDFAAANGGYWLERGESKDVVLLLDGQEYNARLVNVIGIMWKLILYKSAGITTNC